MDNDIPPENFNKTGVNDDEEVTGMEEEHASDNGTDNTSVDQDHSTDRMDIEPPTSDRT